MQIELSKIIYAIAALVLSIACGISAVRFANDLGEAVKTIAVSTEWEWEVSDKTTTSTETKKPRVIK